MRPRHVIADAAYDAGYFRDAIAVAGAQAVIANNPSRAMRIPWSKALYRERNLIERCFLRLKNFPSRRHSIRQDRFQFPRLRHLAACTILWK
jgi:transposase